MKACKRSRDIGRFFFCFSYLDTRSIKNTVPVVLDRSRPLVDRYCLALGNGTEATKKYARSRVLCVFFFFGRQKNEDCLVGETLAWFTAVGRRVARERTTIVQDYQNISRSIVCFPPLGSAPREVRSSNDARRRRRPTSETVIFIYILYTDDAVARAYREMVAL